MGSPDPAAALREVREALEFYADPETHAYRTEQGPLPDIPADPETGLRLGVQGRKISALIGSDRGAVARRALSLLDALEPETLYLGLWCLHRKPGPGLEPVTVLRRREEGV